MVKKGYQTESQAQAEKSRLDGYGINVKQLKLQIDTLVRYTKRQEKLKEISAIEEAKRALDREKSQATAKEVQARTTRESKKSVYLQESARYRELAEEVRKCKIRAPQDGMVVYYMPEQSRWGAGSQQSIVAQGEPVREGQKLMQIPDLKNMLVNTKVHEAMVSRVKVGQPALIRVSSFPDKVFKGSVDSVAAVASQQDFFSSDVKVYTTKVRIDDNAEELMLKPGMSAEVVITTGDPLEKVLAVPVEAIVGSAELGEYRTVYVMGPDGPEEREVIIGASNDSKVEIKVGLQEGDQVVLNPKVLVGDSAKTRTAGGGKKGRHDEEGDGKGGFGKGKGGFGKGGPPNGGKGGPPKGAAKGGGQFDPSAIVQRFKGASPEQRKQMFEATPAEYREPLRQLLQKNGVEIPK
ncbi:MAG TPA: efflux RND transporter periplasmic adaptor subunit [Gemmataceae bacterium]|nr:efflux RND transporter periplasmic adaptor subunit [Gemmataceae bacterium]